MKKTLLLLVLMTSLFGVLRAQTRQITGVVTDKTTNDPIPGVSITVKGTTTVVSSDGKGHYKINVPVAGTVVLVARYIGYKTHETTVGNQDKINFDLQEDVSSLNEVVVNIGYGTVRKEALTGSVSSVSAKDLADFPVSTAAEALAGKLAGVSVTTTEGAPGATIQIRVRGGGSLTQDNSPLYIVDGVQLDNALSILSPAEIQSIDVLKDVASTSIYGARAANGVVIITTKGGKEMKTAVSFDAYAGVRKIVNKLDVMQPYDFVQYQYQLYNLNTSQEVKDSFTKRYGTWEDLDIYKNIPAINWQDKVFGGNAFSNTEILNMTGGTKTTTFNFSLNNTKEDGIMIGSGYRRTFASFRFDHKISDKFRTGINVRYSRQRVDGAGTSNTGSAALNRLRNAVRYQPYANGPDSGDEFDVDYQLTQLTNPLTLAANELKYDYRNDLISSGYVSYNILNNLTFKSTVGFTNYDRKTNSFNGVVSYVGRANGNLPAIVLANANTIQVTNSNVLNYKPNIGKKHSLDILVGEEINQTNLKSNSATIKYFPSNITASEAFASIQKAEPSLYSSSAVQDKPTSAESGNHMLSFFGRALYSYDDRYIATLSIRRDGSSLFADGKRWGNFPSAQVAWRISEEEFLKNKNWDWLNNLKLRFSYGSAGNNRIQSDLYKTLFSASSTDGGYAANDASVVTGLITGNILANPNITWETTISKNLGLDLALFNNRLNASIDLYSNHTKNLILLAAIPPTAGYGYQYQNVGSTQNRGIEFQLMGAIVKKKDFNYTANFNISLNRNKITGLQSGVNSYTQSSGWAGTGGTDDYLVQIGKPVGQFYGYVADGFYKLEDFDRTTYESTGKWVLNAGVANDASILGKATVAPGDLKLQKNADNGTTVVSTADRVVLGNAQPKFTGGLSQQFAWRNFDMSIFMNFSYGGKVYNANSVEFTGQYNVKDNNLLSVMNNRWKWYNSSGALITNWDQLAAANQNTTMWTPNQGNYILTSYNLESASFLRISNVTLGYTLPRKMLQKTKVISKLRVYATVNNLYTITGYSGYDPEANTRSSNPLTPGVDYAAYPRSRYILAGLNLTF
ncbi:TonB-dependent receptor [Pedobacter sp. HMWF019]|uniref:SusC/RagA family TonB-linked outer membrane protein n=1 Tax=Pedobacter sp. HMWF019 TaxID=2056856 RepID=UPI000D3AEF66|nr:TonB-dependent receptor [Pedobacter sp. HMWF019]PTT01707.1 TonB-dependent receptor [Pedobacter sp. HMWF019]